MFTVHGGKVRILNDGEKEDCLSLQVQNFTANSYLEYKSKTRHCQSATDCSMSCSYDTLYGINVTFERPEPTKNSNCF